MLLRRSLIQPRPANHWIWFVVRGRVRHGGRYVLLLLNIILSQVRFQSTGGNALFERAVKYLFRWPGCRPLSPSRLNFESSYPFFHLPFVTPIIIIIAHRT